VNTTVRIINEPVKVGWFAGQLYVEVHQELEENQPGTGQPELVKSVVEKVAAELDRFSDVRVDYQRIRRAASERMGIPVVISRQES